MIQLLETLKDEKKQDFVIVKMDINTFNQITSDFIEFEPLYWSEEIIWTESHKNFINLLKKA